MDTPSRRNFLAAGLTTSAAALGKPTSQAANQPSKSSTTLSKTPALTYRTLGKTGLRVTSVGFGCMITSDATVIERAADLGITYFDTARGYQSGNNERMVGAALKGRRKNLVLSTKSGGKTKEQALEHLDTSLRELGTDWVDIWYLHAKTKPEDITDELMEAQVIARKQGKIRFAGVSTHGGFKEVIPAVAAKSHHFDVLLTSYNFAMEPDFDRLLEVATEAKLGIVAMKVMAGGQRRTAGTPEAKRVQELLKQEGASLAALKWTLVNPKVHTRIPSMTDHDQLDENLKAMSQPFTPAEKKLLEARLREMEPYYCRMCGGCAGTCKQGIPVADELRFLMYAGRYGEFALGREHFRTLPAEIAGVRCADCDGCTVECSKGMNVRAQLEMAQEWLA